MLACIFPKFLQTKCTFKHASLIMRKDYGVYTDNKLFVSKKA